MLIIGPFGESLYKITVVYVDAEDGQYKEWAFEVGTPSGCAMHPCIQM